MYISFYKRTYKRISSIVFCLKIRYFYIPKIKADISINMLFYPIYAFFFTAHFVLLFMFFRPINRQRL